MPEAKHAPGPWSVEPYVDAIRVHDANGDMVCDLSDRRLDLVGMPPENARLIAAAPDLLRACEFVLPVLRMQPAPQLGQTDWPRLADEIDVAISKAKGHPSPTPAEA